jgi:hypothetical protein
MAAQHLRRCASAPAKCPPIGRVNIIRKESTPVHDPVAVFTAETSVEAHFLRNLLADAGIEAHASGDLPGVSEGGLTADASAPQVWVDREDAPLALRVIDDYEQRCAERRGETDDAADGAFAEAVCDACGERSFFPAALHGTVQNCPHCNAYVDVGDDAGEDIGEDSGEDSMPEESDGTGAEETDAQAHDGA